MILTCKQCLRQFWLCDSCEKNKVITRSITESLPDGKLASTTLILCYNPDCMEYGRFLMESAINLETFVCQSCLDLEKIAASINTIQDIDELV